MTASHLHLDYYGTIYRGRWIVRICADPSDRHAASGRGAPLRGFARYSDAKRYVRA